MQVDTGLADQLVAISEAKQVSQGHRSTGRFWHSPKAVAGLAGFTILSLTISLAWIIQGRQSFDATPRALPIAALKVAPTGGVLPVEVEPTLPTKPSPPVAVQVQPQALPSSAALKKEPVTKPSSQKIPKETSSLQKSAAQTEPIQKEPKQKELKQKESRQKESKQKDPLIEPVKQPAVRESVAPDSGAIAPQAKLASSSDSKLAAANRLVGKSTQGVSNVETLCADRSNFLSRGYCQNQYCAEPHRKGDATCQRLRQYELARQTINY
jgi:hypothetical protein